MRLAASNLSIFVLLVLLAAALATASRPLASADTGTISGQARVLDADLLNDVVETDYGQVALPPGGGSAGGPLAPVDLEANDVGLDGLLTLDAPLGASTVFSECDGDPDGDSVVAHCISGVEDLDLGIGINLLDLPLLNHTIITADTIRADAASVGTGANLSSTASGFDGSPGSQVVGLVIDGEAIDDFEPGDVIPVNITINTDDTIEVNSEQALDELGLGALGASVDDLVGLLDELLLAEGDGLLASLTNTLTVDAEIGITGDVTVLDIDQSGNGTASTGVAIVALLVELEVTADLELSLLSELEVEECGEVLNLVTCALGGLVGLLGDTLDALLGDDSLLGGLLSDLGIGFGESTDLTEDATVANVQLGVIELELVSAASAIAGYQTDLTPSIDDIDPDQGPTAGGTEVTITGENFTGATSVTFGDEEADFDVDNDGQITATTPANDAGNVTVTVTTPDGSDTTTFTYVAPPAPSISSMNPDEGPTSGGTEVSIVGSNFVDVESVTFGGTPASDFTVESSSQISATSPPHAAGTVDVEVTTAGGSDTHDFTYYDAPSISSIDPDEGPASGGTFVAITGTGFTPESTVTFDGTPATGVSVVNSGEITAVSPAGSPGTVDVEVTTQGGSDTHDFTYFAAPNASNIDPDEGPTSGGTEVTITGSGLTGTTSVTFGGEDATGFTVDNDGQITATTPPHAPGTVDVVVTNPGGSDTLDFTYIPDAPSLSSIDPDEGPETGGTVVTISGQNFVGTTDVTFGGTPAQSFEVISDTEIEAITPAHAPGTVDVEVTNPGGSDTLDFTYTPGDGTPPSISGIDPDEGPESGGTTVTITGQNFTGTTGVRFGATPATSFEVDNDGQITAVSPAHAPGSVNVVVTTADGSASRSFTYLPDAGDPPSITSINPDEGPETGGTIVTISGNNFTGVTSVTFGGEPALAYNIVNDGQINAVTPPNAPGTVDVEITSPAGTGTVDFTYIEAEGDLPIVEDVLPDEGTADGGTIVIIIGDNFNDECTVTFGGIPAIDVTVLNDGQIRATTPSHDPGTVDVIVSCPAGPASPVQFTYTDDDGDGLHGGVIPALSRDGQAQ